MMAKNPKVFWYVLKMSQYQHQRYEEIWHPNQDTEEFFFYPKGKIESKYKGNCPMKKIRGQNIMHFCQDKHNLVCTEFRKLILIFSCLFRFH